MAALPRVGKHGEACPRVFYLTTSNDNGPSIGEAMATQVANPEHDVTVAGVPAESDGSVNGVRIGIETVK